MLQQRWNWLDLLTKATNDLAREIGEMEPDDPLRSERIKVLYALTELIKSTKAERNKFIYDKMWTPSQARLAR